MNSAGSPMRKPALEAGPFAHLQMPRRAAHQWPAPLEDREPAGCASAHLKYRMYRRISASERFWLGIGRLLYSLSIALESGSLSSIFSGDLSHRVSQSSVRRLVTPTMSGPSFLPWPTVWQARHLLSKLSLPCAASGSVGVADACRLGCSIAGVSACTAVEMSPIAPCEALAK